MMVNKDQDQDKDQRQNKKSSKVVTNGTSNGNIDVAGKIESSSPATSPQASV